METKIGIC